MKQPFTIYRVIRIDGQFDTDRQEGAETAVERAVQKVIEDAMSHSHTIEDGVEVTDITDCGESV